MVSIHDRCLAAGGNAHVRVEEHEQNSLELEDLKAHEVWRQPRFPRNPTDSRPEFKMTMKNIWGYFQTPGTPSIYIYAV